ISIRERGSEKFGTKVELKNLNSFRAVHRAIAYEMKRQILILSEGGTIEQETRGWNDDVGDSYSMRGKENAHDYRYFPEPDLLPVEFTDADIEEFKRNLPELPSDRRKRFIEQYQVTEYDAQVLTQEKPCADYFEAAASKSQAPKLVANWIVGDLMRELSESGHTFSDCPLPPENLAEMVDLIHKGTINGKIGKTVFPEMFTTGKKAADIIKEKGLIQVSDEGAILKFIEDAIAANPAQVQQYREGRKNVLQFFVGQVMKASRGKANPQTVQKLLAEKLG
ncbi:MAG: Asp-tRNA(Asn)/Glu-tRNA(Gln) amidotransferase GatCAB subunit B, partial [Lentisphaeria bacterium]|nr:Asp-tRNA(Asn)/Glu-tRNA(Gln) amidotransferase GatCAB subunit B [Lentisphaeria bacterium]